MPGLSLLWTSASGSRSIPELIAVVRGKLALDDLTVLLKDSQDTGLPSSKKTFYRSGKECPSKPSEEIFPWFVMCLDKWSVVIKLEKF